MSSDNIKNLRIAKEVRQLNLGNEHHGKLNSNPICTHVIIDYPLRLAYNVYI